MLSYGASALVKSLTGDLFSDLLEVYPTQEVYAIMARATLKMIKPSIAADRISVHYKIISVLLFIRIILGLHFPKMLSAICFSDLDRAVSETGKITCADIQNPGKQELPGAKTGVFLEHQKSNFRNLKIEILRFPMLKIKAFRNNLRIWKSKF